MRKFIIDTDTASDDAAAIIMAALDPEIELLGVTSVAGNVSIEQATRNALATLESCDCSAGVFPGAARPLFREHHETISVHGKDGMGDCNLIHPKRTPEKKRAVEFILDMVNQYPGEVEIAVLGPATNIALAILTDRELMKKVKHIWSMGTPGFGPGNATPVSEFNVFIDAEAYALMLESGVPVTIAGFDMCVGQIGIDKKELEAMKDGNKAGKFLEKATSELLQFNLRTRKQHMVDLPDAIAMAAALWDGFVVKQEKCYCQCCTEQNACYGQVIFYKENSTYEACPNVPPSNAYVLTEVNEALFTERFMSLFH